MGIGMWHSPGYVSILQGPGIDSRVCTPEVDAQNRGKSCNSESKSLKSVDLDSKSQILSGKSRIRSLHRSNVRKIHKYQPEVACRSKVGENEPLLVLMPPYNDAPIFKNVCFGSICDWEQRWHSSLLHPPPPVVRMSSRRASSAFWSSGRLS